MFVNGSKRYGQSLSKTFHRCFLPSFSSFGQAVSEEKIFLAIDQPETRIAYGGNVCQRIETIWAIFLGNLIVWFTTTYAISAYHHYSCEFESHSGEV